MDTKASTILLKWILTLYLTSKLFYVQGGNTYASHKTNGISHIPWNILLDPNYMSHKSPSAPNRTSFSPSHFDEYSSPVSYSHSHQQNSFTPLKDNSNHGIYYVSPPTNQFHQSNQNVRYSAPFSFPDHKPSHSFSNPVPSHPPSEKVAFPASSNYQNYRPNNHHNYESHPQQKTKKTQQKVKENEKKKQKKRKPDDYFDMEDEDYLDSYYQDYDYAENERPHYRPSKQTSFSSKYKPGVDPMGLLPSASDPDGFFSKAKDLLRGGSHNRPSYSQSASDYFPQNYSPNKQHEDVAPYTGQSYYDEENAGKRKKALKFVDSENDLHHFQNSRQNYPFFEMAQNACERCEKTDPIKGGYPSKEHQYGSPGYDYEVPYGESHYGAIPYPTDRRKGSKYGPLAFALGLLPLGLLLASLVPTVVTIPVTTAVATGRRKKRSVRFVNPVLDTISEYGVSALEDPVCLNRIFCQVVRDGRQERSSIVQKLYFKIANVLDEKIAAYIGLKDLLIAVRKDECQLFQCSTEKKSAGSQQKT